MTNADNEMSASDRILMIALSEAIGGQQPSIDLVARCRGLLAWIDVDSELAMLLDQPVAEAAGTRGATPPAATLEFAVDDGSVVIEVIHSEHALRGQLLGSASQQVVVRTAVGVSYELPVDELGHFSLENPPSGVMRVECELFPESRRIHTDWFVV